MTRTLKSINQTYYVPRLYDKLVAYIQSCTICGQMKMPVNNYREFVQRIPQNYIPFGQIHMDIKYLVKSHRGYDKILVIVDPFIRYMKCYPLKERTALACAEIILQNIVFEYGIPDMIVYDLDTCFANTLMSYIHKTLKIQQVFVSPGNHQSNVAERFIGTISNFLISNLKYNGRYWDFMIKACCHAYNRFTLASLGYSPWELLYGRPAPDICGLQFDPLEGVSQTYRDYVDLFKQRLKQINKAVVNLQTRGQQQRSHKQTHNVRSRII